MYPPSVSPSPILTSAACTRSCLGVDASRAAAAHDAWNSAWTSTSGRRRKTGSSSAHARSNPSTPISRTSSSSSHSSPPSAPPRELHARKSRAHSRDRRLRNRPRSHAVVGSRFLSTQAPPSIVALLPRDAPSSGSLPEKHHSHSFASTTRRLMCPLKLPCSVRAAAFSASGPSAPCIPIFRSSLARGGRPTTNRLTTALGTTTSRAIKGAGGAQG
ncbi:hypothetical protein T484DRAFT_1963612, partial [Baffinella frigidus]